MENDNEDAENFLQYGITSDDLIEVPVARKEEEIIKVLDKNKITVKDNAGTKRTVPTIEYVVELERTVKRLNEVIRSLKSHSTTLAKKMARIENKMDELSQKGFFQSDY